MSEIKKPPQTLGDHPAVCPNVPGVVSDATDGPDSLMMGMGTLWS